MLDRLLGLGDRVVWVRGNADGELVQLARGEAGDIPDPIAPWAARQLSADHVDWVASLPHPVTLPVDGFGPVVFCYATPRDDEEVVLADSCLERWAEVLADLPREVMTVVCGHTHMPFTRLANTRHIINPGSIGMPYGGPGAHWAVLNEGAVEMRRTAYDPQAACAQITPHRPARTWPSGPATSSTHGSPTRTPWPPSAREMAGRNRSPLSLRGVVQGAARPRCTSSPGLTFRSWAPG